MANEHNLIPNDQRTPSQRRANASKAGKASGRARKKKKELREALRTLLESKLQTDDGILTGTEAMALKAFRSAISGDWKAWELVRDTSGQKPVDKVMTAEVDPDILAEIDRIVSDDGNTETDD